LPGQSIQLHGCSWRQFFLTIESVLQAEDDSHLLRLLHDIREAFLWHGLQILPAQWLHQLSLEGDIKHDKMPGFGITRLSQLSAEDKRLTSGLGLAGLPSMSLRWQHVPLGIAPNHR
jgi:protein-disulfide isomerase-like protein with CxxC motif